MWNSTGINWVVSPDSSSYEKVSRKINKLNLKFNINNKLEMRDSNVLLVEVAIFFNFKLCKPVANLLCSGNEVCVQFGAVQTEHTQRYGNPQQGYLTLQLIVCVDFLRTHQMDCQVPALTTYYVCAVAVTYFMSEKSQLCYVHRKFRVIQSTPLNHTDWNRINIMTNARLWYTKSCPH